MMTASGKRMECARRQAKKRPHDPKPVHRTSSAEAIEFGNKPIVIDHEKDIFSIDLVGDQAVPHRERLGKPLQVDEILKLKSTICPVTGRVHNNSALGPGIQHRKLKGPLPPSELARLRRLVNGQTQYLHKVPPRSSTSLTEPNSNSDVWGSSDGSQEVDWVPQTKAKKAPITYGYVPVNLSLSGQTLPPVEVAGPGQSYNPSVAEWKELIRRRSEQQEHLDAAKRLRSKRHNLGGSSDERFDLRVSSDSEAEDHKQTDEYDTDVSDPGISKDQGSKSRPTAKTRKQRNREKRRKLQVGLENSLQAKKAEHKYFAAVLTSGKLKIALKDTICVNAEAQPEGETLDVSAIRKHKFGKHPIAQSPLDVHLPEELAESLRSLKPEGNLFVDRYASLVRRGIIESRVVQPRRRRYALLRRER